LHGEVARAGGSGQPGGAFGWQDEGQRRRIVVDEPAGGHRRQPLAHVAFIQSSCFGDLKTARRRQRRHGVEQARSMPDAGHQCEHARVQDTDQTFGELLRPFQGLDGRLLSHE